MLLSVKSKNCFSNYYKIIYYYLLLIDIFDTYRYLKLNSMYSLRLHYLFFIFYDILSVSCFLNQNQITIYDSYVYNYYVISVYNNIYYIHIFFLLKSNNEKYNMIDRIETKKYIDLTCGLISVRVLVPISCTFLTVSELSGMCFVVKIRWK